MPTEYTAAIEKGISFENFALSCARAFGACINLRDEDESILPTVENIQFKRDDYHQEQIQEAESDLMFYQNLGDDDWSEKFTKYVWSERDHCKKQISERNELREKYQNMLSKVEDWIPPSSQHIEFKDFMKSQIEGSIKFDTDTSYYESRLNELKELSLSEYKKQVIARLQDDIDYHRKTLTEDNKRNDSRVQWLQQLLNSLKKD